MDSDALPPPQGDAIRACERCSSAMEMLTRLPATSENPSYRIFGCAACHFVEWIAEQITA